MKGEGIVIQIHITLKGQASINIKLVSICSIIWSLFECVPHQHIIQIMGNTQSNSLSWISRISTLDLEIGNIYISHNYIMSLFNHFLIYVPINGANILYTYERNGYVDRNSWVVASSIIISIKCIWHGQ